MCRTLYVFAMLFVTFAAYAQTVDQQEIEERISRLGWEFGAGTRRISASNTIITTSENDAFLKGKDAHEYMRLTEGHDRFKPDALVVKTHGFLADSVISYDHADLGYVKTDDWEKNIDPEEILSIIQSNTAETNKVRKPGYPKLFVDGWAETPRLNRPMAIVTWAIRGHDDRGNRFVNAKALKLGKKGYAILVWAGSPDQFNGAAVNLYPALDHFQFENGYRYADFTPGVDKVAAVGVGAIAYRMLTGTSRKGAAVAGAGLLGFLAVAAKKLWFVIFLPLVFVWSWIKRLFTGR